MKLLVVVFTFFICCLCLLTQAEALRGRNVNKMNPAHLNTLQSTLSELKEGVLTLKTEDYINYLKQFVILESIIDLSQTIFKSCNKSDIGNKITLLTNDTVNLVTYVSGDVESILTKTNQCASESFPKSLECFAALPKKCQAYEPTDASHLEDDIIRWAENATFELRKDISEAASNLEQLIEKVSSPKVQKLAAFYIEHEKYLEACKDYLAVDLKNAVYCFNITGDIANITALFVYGINLGDEIGLDIETIVEDLNVCEHDSIATKYTCYKNVFKEIQSAVQEYTLDCDQFLQNTTAVFKGIAVDISRCFSVSDIVLVEELEKKIQLCRDNLV